MAIKHTLLLLTLLALSACSTIEPVDILTVPKSTSYVSDKAPILVTEQENTLSPATQKPQAKLDFLHAFTQMGLQTQRNKNGFIVFLTGQNNAYFDVSKTTLKPELVNLINSIASEANKPYLHDYRILVTGHTDNTGPKNLNLSLSNGRAKNVENKLAEFGVATARLSSAGYGDSKPLYTTLSQAQYNRRTDLVFIKK